MPFNPFRKPTPISSEALNQALAHDEAVIDLTTSPAVLPDEGWEERRRHAREVLGDKAQAIEAASLALRGAQGKGVPQHRLPVGGEPWGELPLSEQVARIDGAQVVYEAERYVRDAAPGSHPDQET